MEIRRWTQTIQPGEGVLAALEEEDVVLLGRDGKPIAVLVSIERYEERQS